MLKKILIIRHIRLIISFVWPLLTGTYSLTHGADNELGSPVGIWRSYDDNTGLLRALIRIQEQDRSLIGHIEQVYKLPGDTDEDSICHRCSGHRKG